MSNTEILKEYSIKDLKDFCKSYKCFSIQDINGKRITGWNTPKVDIEKHFKECLDRFNSKFVPDGYYYFCFSTAHRYNKDNYDKYLHLKGTAPNEGPVFNNHNKGMESKNDLISVTSALGYITQIAELKTEVNRLSMEVKRLTDENAVLEAELEEAEREGLSEGKADGIKEYLKETSPGLMALADRFFANQDKKLDLEFKKLELGINPAQKKTVKRTIKVFETGSDEHLNFIRLLHKNEKSDELDKELDKLEAQNPEAYQKICTELNLFEDETDNGN